MSMEKLIEEVKKHPCLYDTRLEEYRDQQIKDYAWEEVSRKLNRDCKTIRQDWKKLRDCFRQASSRRKTSSGSQKLWKPWRYEKQMEFLSPYMSSRVATTNIWDIHKNDDSYEESFSFPTIITGESMDEKDHFLLNANEDDKPKRKHNEVSDDEENSAPVSNDVPEEMETSAPTVRDSNHTSKKKMVSSYAERVMNLHDKKVTEKQDDLELFFMSACQSTRRLPRRLQNQIKRDLLDSILRAEELYDDTVAPASSHLYCCSND